MLPESFCLKLWSYCCVIARNVSHWICFPETWVSQSRKTKPADDHVSRKLFLLPFSTRCSSSEHSHTHSHTRTDTHTYTVPAEHNHQVSFQRKWSRFLHRPPPPCRKTRVRKSVNEPMSPRLMHHSPLLMVLDGL